MGFNDDGKYNDCDGLRHRNVDKRMSVEASRREVVVQRAPVKMGIFEFHRGLEGVMGGTRVNLRVGGARTDATVLVKEGIDS